MYLESTRMIKCNAKYSFVWLGKLMKSIHLVRNLCPSMQYVPAGTRHTWKSGGFHQSVEQSGLACVNTRFFSNQSDFFNYSCRFHIVSHYKGKNDLTVWEQFRKYENMFSEPMTLLNEWNMWKITGKQTFFQV